MADLTNCTCRHDGPFRVPDISCPTHGVADVRAAQLEEAEREQHEANLKASREGRR